MGKTRLKHSHLCPPPPSASMMPRLLTPLHLLLHVIHTAALTVQRCDGSPSQLFQLNAGAPSRVSPLSSPALCLATVSCAPAKGDNVVLAACSAPLCPNSAEQLWTLDAQGRLTSAASSNALTLTLANVNGPGVNLWAAQGAAANGEWDFGGAAGGGAGALSTRAPSHACLTAEGGPGSVAVLK